MKASLVAAAFASLLSLNAIAFEILAIGTSSTNGKGVDRDKTYPAQLEAILKADGVPATVVNAGVNGDLPIFMFKRLQESIGPETRIVIVEPGPNDPNPAITRDYAEKMLAYLHDRGLPAIYISSGTYQTVSEGRELAAKYGAYYYGHYGKGVPLDSEHYQFDQQRGGKGRGGHMTAEGCAVVAKNMAPLVEKVIREKALTSPVPIADIQPAAATHVVSITTPVPPGGLVTLVVETKPGASCLGERQGHFSDDFSIELPQQTAGADGRVSWEWRVRNGNRPIGLRQARVTCTVGDRKETLETSFSVE